MPLKNESSSVLVKGQIPGNRAGHAAVLYNSSMLIFGGTNLQQLFNDVYEYSIETKTWKKLSTRALKSELDIPDPREGHSAIVYQSSDDDAEMIIFGGGNETVALDKCVYSLNLKDLVWKRLTLERDYGPSGRYKHCCVLYKDTMIIHGGKYINDNLWKFDLKNHKWAQIPFKQDDQAPGERYGHSAVVVGNNMIVYGGFFEPKLVNVGEPRKFNDLYMLNLENFKWKKMITSLTAPSPRYGHRAVAYMSKIYIIGGEASSGANIVYELNILKNIWIPVGKIPAKLKGHSMVLHENKLLIFGGCDDHGEPNNNLYEFALQIEKASKLPVKVPFSRQQMKKPSSAEKKPSEKVQDVATKVEPAKDEKNEDQVTVVTTPISFPLKGITSPQEEQKDSPIEPPKQQIETPSTTEQLPQEPSESKPEQISSPSVISSHSAISSPIVQQESTAEKTSSTAPLPQEDRELKTGKISSVVFDIAVDKKYSAPRVQRILQLLNDECIDSCEDWRELSESLKYRKFPAGIVKELNKRLYIPEKYKSRNSFFESGRAKIPISEFLEEIFKEPKYNDARKKRILDELERECIDTCEDWMLLSQRRREKFPQCFVNSLDDALFL